MELFEESTKPKRGKAIVVILVILVIVRLYDILISIRNIAQDRFADKVNQLPNQFYISTIIIDVLFIVFCIVVLLRKKWGLIGLASILIIQAISPFVLVESFPFWAILPILVGSALGFVIVYSLYADYA